MSPYPLRHTRVWIFCGTTPDYHQPTDSIDRVDYAKMEKVTKFTYVACLDIGNKPAMMKLDVHPEVTTTRRKI